jgi:hypothetical protein
VIGKTKPLGMESLGIIVRLSTRKIRYVTSQQVTPGYGISVLGGIFFVLGMGHLFPGSTPKTLVTGNHLMQVAGWFVVAGWLVQRVENEHWPFRPSNQIIKQTVSEICLPLALLFVAFLSIVFLVGLMLTPFVLFVFSKLF